MCQHTLSAQGMLAQPGLGTQEACRAWQCLPCSTGAPATGMGAGSTGSRRVLSEDVPYPPEAEPQSGNAHTWPIAGITSRLPEAGVLSGILGKWFGPFESYSFCKMWKVPSL